MEEEGRQAFVAAAEAMYDELREWRRTHPEASFDEIVEQITIRRRRLMAGLAAQIALQHGAGVVPEGLRCEQCGAVMRYKGEAKRGIEHMEGSTEIDRAYYYCPACEVGLFPPG